MINKIKLLSIKKDTTDLYSGLEVKDSCLVGYDIKYKFLDKEDDFYIRTAEYLSEDKIKEKILKYERDKIRKY